MPVCSNVSNIDIKRPKQKERQKMRSEEEIKQKLFETKEEIENCKMITNAMLYGPISSSNYDYYDKIRNLEIIKTTLEYCLGEPFFLKG